MEYRRHTKPDAHWRDGVRLFIAFAVGFLALVAVGEAVCAACGCPWYL